MKTLVIGDLIVDKYVHCDKMGISAETPTIVGKFKNEEYFLGGAALVVRHLEELGEEVSFFCANDNPNYFITNNVQSSFFRFKKLLQLGYFIDPVQKVRYFVENYKLFQMDVFPEGTFSAYQENKEQEILIKLIDYIQKEKIETLVFADNRHGVITEFLAQSLISAAKDNNVKTYVDSQISQKESNHHWYKGADLFFINQKEYKHLISENNIIFGLDGLCKKFNIGGVVLKLGENGCVSYIDNGFSSYLPFIPPVKIVDTCGCGDAFLSGYIHGGGDCHLANRWAAWTGTFIGTKVPNKALFALPEEVKTC